ncbi:ABC transporter permease [Ochrobactrum sp. BTU2]|uniref:ABC transporter permease n=1 Tax=Ochrobactrum sp. BTU2 TaxID=2856166 RepID=UPI00211A75AB|nr:ABC transporter permease [Ochrobactrum sp. BTU2]MCQ9147726.1 ABC transporter permease [Ochrobactrum sp. BTU2]
MTDKYENLALLVPGLALLAFAFLAPIAQMLMLAFTDPGNGEFGGPLQHFYRFLSDGYYLGILWRTVRLSLTITVISAVIGFPFAYIVSRVSPSLRLWLVVMVILPLMTSVVVRTFGWMVLLGRNGPVSDILRALGLVQRNFSLMHTETAIIIGMVQVLLPFMVLSLIGVIGGIDRRLEEAARTMGCSFLSMLRTVILPLSLPGLVSGSLLVFTLSASSFVTPSLLGGARIEVLAGSIYKSVTQTLDWPFAAAQAVILFLGVALLLVPYMTLSEKRNG